MSCRIGEETNGPKRRELNSRANIITSKSKSKLFIARNTSTIELKSPAKAYYINEQERREANTAALAFDSSEPASSSIMNGSGEGLENTMTAASALTDLSRGSSPLRETDEDSIDSHQEEGKGELQLPVRFYKNGRKRAVPFVLKVNIPSIYDFSQSFPPYRMQY